MLDFMQVVRSEGGTGARWRAHGPFERDARRGSESARQLTRQRLRTRATRTPRHRDRIHTDVVRHTP
eukprot:6207787-Pleurochrysis_carterae.AAC.1